MSEYQRHFDAPLSDGTRKLTNEEIAFIAGGISLPPIVHAIPGIVRAVAAHELNGLKAEARGAAEGLGWGAAASVAETAAGFPEAAPVTIAGSTLGGAGWAGVDYLLTSAGWR